MDFKSGQWVAMEELMFWLNTLEDKVIPKTWVYEFAMKYRPK